MNIDSLKKLSDTCYEIPKTGGMRVPGRVFVSRQMAKDMEADQSLLQVANVACLPGIVRASLAMPDMHWGYGFPIGGVAAFDAEEGVVSPGGVGYDINCGVRLAGTRLEASEVSLRLRDLVEALFREVPSGVGVGGNVKLSGKDMKKVLVKGARFACEMGMGDEDDLLRTEEGGALPGADPELVSDRALTRGRDQLGTLGAGNHFVELCAVDEVYDPDAADAYGLFPGQLAVSIHSGSRGLGHQVCDDYLATLSRHVKTLGIELPDRQLACAYVKSEEGRRYLSAMACAANFAWANRQVLLFRVREALMHALCVGPRDLGLSMVYDVCHNIAKLETHLVDGRPRKLCVHRKGATRAFAPGHPAVCEPYRAVGQPVLVPGDMGTCSYVLKGSETAMAETFGSTCHGAGRRLSRSAAMKKARGRRIDRELADKGILVRAAGRGTLAEEMPEAYKDVSQVVEVVHAAGISTRVARLVPLAVIKG
ncbi:MAG: RtcB family protein [Thermodesulfobacteriota bacterium]